MPSPFVEDMTRRSIKIVDIGWATSVYFMLAFCTVWFMFGHDYDPASATEANKPTWLLGMEIVGHIWLIGTLSYFARNLFGLVPWPFDGIYGFDHLLVKEVNTSFTYSVLVVMFDTRFQKQVAEFKRRVGFIRTDKTDT